MDVDTN